MVKIPYIKYFDQYRDADRSLYGEAKKTRFRLKTRLKVFTLY